MSAITSPLFLLAARNEVIAALKYEHKMTGWILRLGGFPMMRIGLSIVTIIVSMIAHNPIALVIAVAIVIGPWLLIGRPFKKKKAAPPAKA